MEELEGSVGPFSTSLPQLWLSKSCSTSSSSSIRHWRLQAPVWYRGRLWSKADVVVPDGGPLTESLVGTLLAWQEEVGSAGPLDGRWGPGTPEFPSLRSDSGEAEGDTGDPPGLLLDSLGGMAGLPLGVFSLAPRWWLSLELSP